MQRRSQTAWGGAIAQIVEAVDHIRRMRGGSQSHLLRCSDGHHYVVKFQNNPQGRRILTNELLGTSLAESIGLPVQQTAIVRVSDHIVEWSRGLLFHLAKAMVPCQAGLCFGSLYPDDSSLSLLAVHDFLPHDHLRNVENLSDFAGMLVFDKWVCNTDDRQAIFSCQENESPYRVSMIDQGSCFNGEKWNFPDAPLHSLYRNPVVYETIQGLEAFAPWIEAVERNVDEKLLCRLADEIPQEWYDGNTKALRDLVQRLDRRRAIIKRLLLATREASTSSFPRWAETRARAASPA